MRTFLVLVYISLVAIGFFSAHADVEKIKYGNLPTRGFLFLYSKTPNVMNLGFGKIYSVRQVEDAMACHEYITLSGTVDNDEAVFIIGKCGGDFKEVILLHGERSQHSA